MRATDKDLRNLERFALVGNEQGRFIVKNQDRMSRKRKSNKDQSLYQKHIHKKVSILEGFIENKDDCNRVIYKLRDIYEKGYFSTKDNILMLLAKIVRTNVTDDGSDHHLDTARDKAYNLAFDICNKSSDLFTFVSFDKHVVEKEKVSWGRGLRSLICKFYQRPCPTELAKDVMSSRQGHGFKHMDLIRQCHLKANACKPGTEAILGYLAKEPNSIDEKFAKSEDDEVKEVVKFISEVGQLNSSFGEDKDKLRGIIEKYSLSIHQIPESCKQYKEVYEALLHHAPLSQLLQNLYKMARIGLLDPPVINTETDQETLPAHLSPA